MPRAPSVSSRGLRAGSIPPAWSIKSSTPPWSRSGKDGSGTSYSVYQERLITVFLRRKLSDLIEAARRTNSASGPQRDRRNRARRPARRGVMIFHHAMELRGWRVHNLGVDLPVREFTAAIRGCVPRPWPSRSCSHGMSRSDFRSSKRCRTIPVFVGGRSIINYQSWPGPTASSRCRARSRTPPINSSIEFDLEPVDAAADSSRSSRE